MGLDLADPTSIQATCTGHNGDTYPQSSQIEFHFPSNEWRGDCKVVWYDGGNLPSTDLLLGLSEFKLSGKTARGAIIVGEKGSLYSWGDYAQEWMLLPEG